MSQYQPAASTVYSSNRQPRQAWRRNQNQVKFSIGSNLGPVAHTVLIAIMLCILGLIYLTQLTKTSTYGYEINSLQTKKEQLLSEKRDLEVESARLQALERAQTSSVARAMDKPAATEHAQN